MAFIVGWFGLISLLYISIPTEYLDGSNISGGDFFAVNTTTSTGEVDTGIFSGIGASVDMIFRFFLFAALGIGLPSGTPTVISVCFSVLVIFINLIVIFTIKNAFWKG